MRVWPPNRQNRHPRGRLSQSRFHHRRLSPSATATAERLVDSLGPADLQAFITLLKSNFTEPDAITDTKLNRATVQGLLARLPRGITLLPGKENVPAAASGAFYSELIAGRAGSCRSDWDH